MKITTKYDDGTESIVNLSESTVDSMFAKAFNSCSSAQAALNCFAAIHCFYRGDEVKVGPHGATIQLIDFCAEE